MEEVIEQVRKQVLGPFRLTLEIRKITLAGTVPKFSQISGSFLIALQEYVRTIYKPN